MKSEGFTSFDLVDNPSFRAYVDGSDPEAVRFWTDWVAQHPDRQHDVAEATRIVRALGDYRPRGLTPDQIDAEIRQLQEKLATPVAEVRPLWHRAWLWQAAATFILAMGLLSGWWYLRQRTDSTPVADRMTNAAQPAAPPLPAPEGTAADTGPLSYRTGFGERRTVTLPDGSVVRLNANSELALASDWSPGNREVILTGEAFFQVQKQQHDGKRVKFIVRAANVAVEVLGTTFDVSTRNRKVKVVLNEGKIRLNVAQRTLDLQPGDLVEVNKSQAITLRSRIEPEEHSAWTADELVFDETPLSDIAQLIENNYGYRVAFTDPALARRRLTATVPDPSLDVLLSALEKAFSLNITRQDKTLLIQSARVSKP
ncbi:anti-FecI sigma factor, FecR [Fibrisoma limi BUZ 3]|uniref:Anti-FecI sigma factor, FecR n=1 Tax=Fibrisoma limi BUZ 3 TaxID=1185876 RepID=I2GHJ8_9BACT|nr:FecR domain-containing protein [Fibrisoma limi]CCH53373.1 anti-FecI sigma factor, FecR [Fibrisoma limi BUZ 3]